MKTKATAQSSFAELGFGCMRLPRSQKEDEEAINLAIMSDMVDCFIEAGFSYFDTARGYHEGQSEGALKRALVDRYPRSDYRIASKLPAFLARDARNAEAMFHISLEDTGVDYFDSFLLHNLGGVRTQVFEDFGIWDFLYKQKQKGLIERLGFSFHGSAKELADIFVAHPEVDFVQLQINYADWESDSVQSRKCYELARSRDLPIVVMEPLKGGLLAQPPDAVKDVLSEEEPGTDPVSWALRFASSLEGVHTVLSGMSTFDQVQQNVKVMKEASLLQTRELAAIEKAAHVLEGLALVPCTTCGYCSEVCPEHVRIAESLSALNILNTYGDLSLAKQNYLWATDGKASTCVACGKCEQVCPQHIEIIPLLEKVATTIEQGEMPRF